MKTIKFSLLIFMAAIFLAACTGTPGESSQSSVQLPADDSAETAVQESNPAVQPDSQTAWPDGQVQQDAQGQVDFAITPLNLSNHNGTLDFDVAMNTHSVDLSMDLAMLATLSTDTGLTVNASAWSAPGGGHHVSGALQFPAVMDDVHILDNASRLILTIRDVDAAERVFTWSLSD